MRSLTSKWSSISRYSTHALRLTCKIFIEQHIEKFSCLPGKGGAWLLPLLFPIASWDTPPWSIFLECVLGALTYDLLSGQEGDLSILAQCPGHFIQNTREAN